MTSLHRHGAKEAHKQLHLRMQRSGLNTVKVSVTRKSGRLDVQFTGSDDQVKKAEQIFADWT
jgi:N-methylhydantoinase B/oxoprolinase/acetone carboxylase alpha subunit